MIVVSLVLLMLALGAAQKSYVNFEFRAAEDAYSSILLKKNLSQLATIPFCYRNVVDSAAYLPTQPAPSNLTWSDYVSTRINETRRSPIKMSLYLQLLQLVDLSEKDQSLTMVMSTVTTWMDCRLRWDEAQFNVSRISLTAQKFKKLQVFSPGVRLLEAIDPQSAADSETGAYISSNGTVVVTREFSVTFSCDIGVEMFPFDIQICYLTFESILDESIVNITYLESSVQQESEYLIGRYVPSDDWALTILPPLQKSNYMCAKDDDVSKMECYSGSLQYKLILRRHPTYNLNNLFFPAFLIVLLSSFVFVIPPGAGEKMDLNVAILLSFYMFSALMYEKMPETGSVIPLLSQYFLVCTGLISASCLYSAISAVISFARSDVPKVIQNFVVAFGPYLINDQINPSKCEAVEGQVAVTNPKIESSKKPVEQVRMSYLAEGEDDDDDDEFEGFCIDDRREIKWDSVAALLDRCFMILHLLASFSVLGIYLAKGYVPWTGYSEVDLDQKAINYICYQSLHAEDIHDDFDCPDFNFTMHDH